MKSVKQMFVYGTLMSGQRNHHYFEDNILEIVPATIEAELYHLEAYDCPTLVIGSGQAIGELITYIDPEDQIENSIIALEQDFDGLYYDQIPAMIKTINGKIEKDVFVYKIQENDEVQFVINKWSSKCK